MARVDRTCAGDIMKAAIAFPPIPSEKGVPLLSQNRQFQWFNEATYIFPVVPAYAATMAHKAGHEVTWLDGIAGEWTEEEFLLKVLAAQPDVMLIETKTPVVKAHWKWISRLKERLPQTKLALVGDHVTALPAESFANSPVDYVLTGGDYDFLFVNLLAHLKDKVPLEPGIWYREGAEVRNTGPFVCEHDLAAQPWIDRDLANWQLYSVKNGNFRRTPGAYMMSGRDCWHGQCTFCSWTTLYPNYRKRDPIDAVNEIGDLIERYGVREVMDDTGTFPTGEWLRTFCKAVIERGYNKRINIDCNMRFGTLGIDDYRLMKEAGFRFVLFGLESANQATLDRLKKNLKVEDILKGAADASRAGLAVHVTVMFGYPWEGPDEIAKTVKLARELMIRGFAHSLQVTLVIPYPGTPLFKECDEKGLVTTHDWDEFDMRRAVMKSGAGEEEIKSAIREVYRSYFHPLSLWYRFAHARRLFDDLRYYWRGFFRIVGHLRDFSK